MFCTGYASPQYGSVLKREGQGVLVVILGAGASFDSDPARPANINGYPDRPPLADQLFDDRSVHTNAMAAFSRATPAIMRAREDVKAGDTVEASLARLQQRSDSSPKARAQLMAIRFYLQRVLSAGPDAWTTSATRQTTYVNLLEQLDDWREDRKADYCLITFNYDLMLEDARRIVHGEAAHADSIVNYLYAPSAPRVYKPHGSVNWGRAAEWDGPTASGDDMRRMIIETQPDRLLEEWAVRPAAAVAPVTEHIGDPSLGTGKQIVWLPVLAIPVEIKPELVMPPDHLDAMKADLRRATSVLTIGWRGREQHFLDVLRECLPAEPVPLVAVAETEEAAGGTLDNLWSIGKFNRFRRIGGGFSSFAPTETTYSHADSPSPNHTLGELLRGNLSLGSRQQHQTVPQRMAPLPTTRRPYGDFPPVA